MIRVEGLVKDFTEFRVGDRLYKFQEKDASEWTLEELERTIQDELKLTIEVLHPDKMKEEVKILDLPIDKGDVVPLKDYKDKPELNGKDVEVLRKLSSGKYLVSPVGKQKEKLLIDASNLHLEIETDKLTLKDLSDEEESVDDEDGGEEQATVSPEEGAELSPAVDEDGVQVEVDVEIEVNDDESEAHEEASVEEEEVEVDDVKSDEEQEDKEITL